MKRTRKTTVSSPTLTDGFTQMVEDVEFRLRVDQQRVTVFLDGLESSALNLLDPAELEFEYMQYMSCVVNAFFPLPAPLRALHLGAAACSLPLAWETLRPGSRQVAVDLNGELLHLVRELFPLPKAPALKLRQQDASVTLAGVRPGKFQVIVRDVFADARTPEPLRSANFYEQAAAALGGGGVLLVNCRHGDGVDVREEARAALTHFRDVYLFADGKTLAGGRCGNVVLAGRNFVADEDANKVAENWLETDRYLRKLAFPVRLLPTPKVRRWAGV
ncbi:fused MFS/spermidine synthase [Gleimia sp. 6138-11-ORH1]|uniref:spermidine synthase n=1 Tax=Gleimia sp. 6138-11-ORH1 TaxID=2973937 RepID=UPI00216978FB|nr:fused MFS/spermidine synthase [Gleimia sp. 6138-11-ORH1]MCS4484249.1 fused MFS/spermidine synthase [Gleimia sp. 6138-11-ORH1]